MTVTVTVTVTVTGLRLESERTVGYESVGVGPRRLSPLSD